MSIYVSPSLDQDQRIYRTISFYELVELMTYGRLSFDESANIQLAPLRSRASSKALRFDRATADITHPESDPASETNTASTTLAYQSWTMLEHEQSIDWGRDDEEQPSIHIVSTIHALAESLFVGEEMEAFIGRTSLPVETTEALQATYSRDVAETVPGLMATMPGLLATAPGLMAIGAPPYARGLAQPVAGTLAVTLWPRKSAANRDQKQTPRIPIDLRTLVKSVLVSPKAPTRFVELVAHLVQRVSHARVARANLFLSSAKAATIHA